MPEKALSVSWLPSAVGAELISINLIISLIRNRNDVARIKLRLGIRVAERVAPGAYQSNALIVTALGSFAPPK